MTASAAAIQVLGGGTFPDFPSMLIDAAHAFFEGAEDADLARRAARLSALAESLLRAPDESHLLRLLDAVADKDLATEFAAIATHPASSRTIQRERASLRVRNAAAWELTRDLQERLEALSRSIVAEKLSGDPARILHELQRTIVVQLCLAIAAHADVGVNQRNLEVLWVEGRKSVTNLFMFGGGTIETLNKLETSRDRTLAGTASAESTAALNAKLGL